MWSRFKHTLGLVAAVTGTVLNVVNVVSPFLGSAGAVVLAVTTTAVSIVTSVNRALNPAPQPNPNNLPPQR